MAWGTVTPMLWWPLFARGRSERAPCEAIEGGGTARPRGADTGHALDGGLLPFHRLFLQAALPEPMTTENPLSLPGAWNEVAEGYAAELLPVFELYSADALALAKLPPRASVIDVAAGPGTLALLAAPVAARVEALDFSETMVRVLDRRIRDAGLTNVRARQGDGQSLPFDDETFDGGFSMFGLMFFPDRAAGFRELRRVIKPGGRAVVSSWAPLDQVPLLAALFGAIRELLPGLPFGGGKAPLSEADDFREEMEGAAFSRVEIQSLRHRVEAASVREFWATQVRSSAPIALLRRKLEPEQWEALSGDLVPRLEREFGGGPVELEWPALLGIGVR